VDRVRPNGECEASVRCQAPYARFRDRSRIRRSRKLRNGSGSDRDEASVADDDVVEQRDADQAAGLDQAARDGEVLGAGLGVAARVVVGDDQRAGAGAHREAVDLARVHQAGGRRALADAVGGEQAVAAVQRQRPEGLSCPPVALGR